ncbi:MAG: ankyrin repeat domain-containing protein [Verrucomicrobiae bacterium]|nr:ankyrin repeat domain-containing protein [Verrucomicrobiae bacterium]
MSKRKRVLVIALPFVALSLIGWWFFQWVYWPRVTQPSTVSAAEAGDLQLLQSLQQQGMSLDYQDPRKFKWTPLMAAVYSGQSNVVVYLLKQGVDIEARDAHGNTALMWAVDVADTNFSIVQLLLTAGAKTNVTNDFGRTVFDAAGANPEKERLLRILSQYLSQWPQEK